MRNMWDGVGTKLNKWGRMVPSAVLLDEGGEGCGVWWGGVGVGGGGAGGARSTSLDTHTTHGTPHLQSAMHPGASPARSFALARSV